MQQSAIFLCTPRFISAIEIDKNPNWFIQHHNAEYTEILYIQEGNGEFCFEGQNFPANAGDLIIFNPIKRNQGNSSNTDPIKGISISFSNLHINGKKPGCLMDPTDIPIVNLQEENEGIYNFIYAILNEYQAKSDGYQDIISSLLQTIIIKIYRLIEKTEPASTSNVALLVKRYIDDNYRNELTLTELANQVYVSPFHLVHVFKEEVGLPPIQYMIQCRMEEAKRLLEHSDLSVKEIASIIGYENANYFNLLFKKMTGKPPGKYRKMTTKA